MDAHENNLKRIFYFNYFVAAILAINIYIDISVMMFGNKLVRENIFKLENVKIFAILMAICAIGLIWFRRKFILTQIWQKLLYALTCLYFIGLTAYHIQAFIDQNIIYYATFPRWLTPILVILNACFIYLFCNIRSK